MLRFFRINDPYRLISLLALLVLAGLPLLIDLPSATMQELKDLVLGEQVGSKTLYVEIIDRTPPLLAVLDGFLNFFFGRSLLARHVLALLIVFFQASYFAILLINNKAYNENTYVPSLVFGFLCFFSFDVIALTPELIASTLLLLALNNIFKEIEFRVDRDSIVLNLGVFLGLASLVVFSFSIFLLGTVFILVVFARATLRKILLLLFGYGLVHAIVFTVYYYHGRVDDLWMHFYAATLAQEKVMLLPARSLLLLGAFPIGYFVISLFMLTREARFTKYQSQIFQVLFLWLFLALLELLLTATVTPHSLVTFVPTIAYFISHYLLLIRRKWIAEVMLWIFIGGLLSVGFLARKQLFSDVSYAKLFAPPSPYAARVKDKRVMIVGKDMALYEQNKLGGSFLDWELSRGYLEQAEDYDNLIRINDAFTGDPPEVIVDENGLMDRILERIPRLKNMYRKEGNIYWLR